MNDANQIRIEAEFPVKGSELLLAILID